MSLTYSENNSSVNQDDLNPSSSLDTKKMSPEASSGTCVVSDESGGHARITCPPQLVYSIDTLKVSLWLKWADHSFLDSIKTRKEVVQQTDMKSCPFDFWGISWNLYRIGNSNFPYHLSTGDTHLWLNNRKHDANFSTASIEIGSLSSWVPGAYESFNKVIRFLEIQGASITRELVSRADFACDCIDTYIEDIDVENEKKWITRANKFATYRNHNKLTGITRGKGDLMLRIYDKVQELKEKRSTAKQNLFSQIWRVSTYDEKPITRVEFQIRREVLKQFEEKSGKKIETVKQLMFAQNSLWEYFTGQWARHTRRSIDRKNNNQSNAKDSQFWKNVCSAKFSGVHSFHRQSKKVVKLNTDALRDQIRGCLMTIVASQGQDSDDIYGIMNTARDIVMDDLINYYSENYSKFHKKFKQRQNNALGWID